MNAARAQQCWVENQWTGTRISEAVTSPKIVMKKSDHGVNGMYVSYSEGVGITARPVKTHSDSSGIWLSSILTIYFSPGDCL
jgi:hypothetical protein